MLNSDNCPFHPSSAPCNNAGFLQKNNSLEEKSRIVNALKEAQLANEEAEHAHSGPLEGGGVVMGELQAAAFSHRYSVTLSGTDWCETAGQHYSRQQLE